MGRIKTKQVKAFTQELFDKHKEKFTDDYAKNKEIIAGHANIHSQKLNNIVAGYITKLVKLSKREN